jgi:hypothetical protein
VGREETTNNSVTGDVEIGGFREANSMPESTLVGNYLATGSLEIRRRYSAYFATGWSHIVPAVDPTVIH